ncbi:unnamed protein product [Absidia cylindrospora]
MDYYSVLEVPETATLEEIKQAYKKQALLHHPDRMDPSATKAQRQEATKRFQLIADALYTLSDDRRRRDYDELENPTNHHLPVHIQLQVKHITFLAIFLRICFNLKWIDLDICGVSWDLVLVRSLVTLLVILVARQWVHLLGKHLVKSETIKVFRCIPRFNG